MIANIVDHRTAERNRIARAILEFRRRARGVDLDRATVNLCARQLAGASSAPPKPTVENLQTEAREAWEYGCEPIRPHGDEYYSQCGLDDLEGERKEHAREHALSIWRAIGRPLP